MRFSLGKRFRWEVFCEVISFILFYREKIRKILRGFRKKDYYYYDVIFDVETFFLYLLFKNDGKGSVNRVKYLLIFMKYFLIITF